MYNFYNNFPEKRNTWRNAYEIKAAALEHEKRRFQEDHNPSARPQTIGRRKSGWNAILKATTRLLTILIG